MTVYIASDQPLPLLAWDPTCPSFHVTELDEAANAVRQRFSRPHVCYVGSHEKCGCGFQYGEYEYADGEEEADVGAKRESRRRLAEYLRDALRQQSMVELYACWAGDEALEPEHRVWLRPGDLLGARTFFRERELVIVSEASGGR